MAGRGSRAHRPGDPVAHGEVDPVPDRGNGASALEPEGVGERDGIDPLPLVDVDEVHPGRGNLDEGLAGLGIRQLHLIIGLTPR